MEQKIETSSDVLIKKVVGLAMKVHRELGTGFLESVYANALSLELGKAGIAFEREKRIPVFYEENIVGEFIASQHELVARLGTGGKAVASFRIFLT